MTAAIAYRVWTCCLFVTACVCRGIAVVLALLATGLLFFVDMFSDAADVLGDITNQTDDAL